jgi:hypothetical protein
VGVIGAGCNTEVVIDARRGASWNTEVVPDEKAGTGALCDTDVDIIPKAGAI